MTIPVQPDEWKINVHDAWQVLWWCRYLGLTKGQLEHAINAVGPVIVDVKQYLSAQKMRRNDFFSPKNSGDSKIGGVGRSSY